jgi:hypothetical protein
MAMCKSVTIPGMTGHVRRNTHDFLSFVNFLTMARYGRQAAVAGRILKILMTLKQYDKFTPEAIFSLTNPWGEVVEIVVGKSTT